MAPDAQGFARGMEAQGEPILYVVRHGETELNAGNHFRGFKDVPLDKNGKAQADEIRDFLAEVDFVNGYSSDLQRAYETLQRVLGKKNGFVPQRLVALRPWNIGQFSGLLKTPANKKSLQTYADSPDKPIPDGESLEKFRSRYQHCLEEILHEARRVGPILVVQHASNDHEIGNILYGNIDALDVEPGGVIGIYLTAGGYEGRALKGAVKKSSEARYTS